MYRLEVTIPESSLHKPGFFSISIDSLMRRFTVPTSTPIVLFVPHLSIHSSLSIEHVKDSIALHKLSITIGDFVPELQGKVDQWFRMESAESSGDGDTSATLTIRVEMEVVRLERQESPETCSRCLSYQKRLRSCQMDVESLTSQLRTYPALQGEISSLRIGSLSLVTPQTLTQQEKDYIRYAFSALEEKAKLSDLLQSQLATLQAQLVTTVNHFQDYKVVSEETLAQLHSQSTRLLDDLKHENDQKNQLLAELTALKSQLATKTRIEQDLNSQLQRVKQELSIKTAQSLLYSQAEFENSELKVALTQLESQNKRLLEDLRKINEEFKEKTMRFEEQTQFFSKKIDEKDSELNNFRENLLTKTKLAEQLLMEKLKIESQLAIFSSQNKEKEENKSLHQILEKKLKQSEDLKSQLNSEIVQKMDEMSAEMIKIGKEKDNFVQEREKLYGIVRELEQKLQAQEGVKEKMEVEMSEQTQRVVVLEQALCDRESAESLLESLSKSHEHACVLTLELTSEVDTLSDRLLRHSEKILAGQKVIAKLADVVEKQNEDLRVVRKMFRNQGPYVPESGDTVDEALGRYINDRLIPPPVPFKREEPGVYLFGSRRIAIKVEQGRLIVRVGGGYVSIDDFITSYTPSELEKMENRRTDKATDPFLQRLAQYFETKSANTTFKAKSRQRRHSP